MNIAKDLPERKARQALHEAEVTLLAISVLLSGNCQLWEDDAKAAREMAREWYNKWGQQRGDPQVKYEEAKRVLASHKDELTKG